jgi:hypothetical protein
MNDINKFRLSIMATSRTEAMEWIELGLLLYEARMRMRGQIHNSNPAVVSADITGIDVCESYH